jgi:hypothetical protein
MDLMSELLRNWGVPFSLRAVWCLATDSSTQGPARITSNNNPRNPRVYIDRATERTVEALGVSTGVVIITD